MKRQLILLVFLAVNYGIRGQQFAGNPPSIKWRQINTPIVRIIFPEGLDTIANNVTNIIERLNKTRPHSLGESLRKINLVLQNQTTISNGYVGLGPFRSEFFLTPLQNSFQLGSLPWPEQLAIHEYRHVQQYNNFDVGLSKVFRTLFGEEGQALANNLTVPDWFFEGDAVFNETYVSKQGRGRLPYFFNGYRSLWAADKKYNWMKLRNGSLRDYTPDHYPLGYMLVSYGYEKYGDEFWKKVTHDAAAFKGLFYPFQKAIKKYSGQDYISFRRSALDYFKSQFTDDGADSLSHYSHFIANEEYPAYINDSSIVFVRESYKQIPVFIIKTGKQERRLRVKDVSIDNHFSYRNNKIVYAAYQPDRRWGWKDYSVLNVLDIKTGKQHTITKRSKYFSPDISEDGKRIVAVQVRADGKSLLHILNADDGSLIQELRNDSDFFYTYPKFYSSNEIVSAVRNKAGKMSLVLINTISADTKYLLPFNYNVISFPAIQNDTIYFSASAGGKDKLFAFSIKTKSLMEIIVPSNKSGIGNYQPAVNKEVIGFIRFTAIGNRIQEIPKKEMLFTPVNNIESEITNFDINVLSKNEVHVSEKALDNKHIANIYPRSFHLFNFHSFEPFFSDPDYRFSLVGQNILNTLQSELFFNYNSDEGFKQFGFNAIYGGWFPTVSFGASYIIDRKDFTGTNQSVYWNEAELRGGLGLPLNLSKGRSITSLTPRVDYVFKNVSYKGAFKNFGSNSFGYINATVLFSNQLQSARQQIYPHLAQSIVLNYSNAIHGVAANQFTAVGSFYLPGLFVNHNMVISLAYHQRDTLGQYSFSNSFPFSRGYEAPNLSNMFKWGVNYHFPLFYPDAGVANIVYILRVRANLFYDATKGKVHYTNGRFNTDFRSAGTEVFFDTKWWNEFPVSFGLRYSYLLDRDLFGANGTNRFEIILPVNLFQR